ncbi:MAG: hypothetical protein ACYTGB_18285 [Planctomycetota bacterium]|jgi:hypothetical protein
MARKTTRKKKKTEPPENPVTVGGFKLCLTSAVAPQWDAKKLVAAAVKYGYAGVELSAGS